MEDEFKRPVGYWPLAAQKAVTLRPERCGSLRVRRAQVLAGDEVLGTDGALRLWSGDSVQVLNAARSSDAHFSWDYCRTQPRRRERLVRAFVGLRPKRLRAVVATLAGVGLGALAVAVLLATRLVPFFIVESSGDTAAQRKHATQPCC